MAPGDLVEIVDADGPVTLAFADPTSPIRARVLAEPGTTLDGAWVSGRVRAAAELRARDPLLVGTTGVRLVHGEADGCPGLVIDRYADTAVIVLDGAGSSAWWRRHLDAVIEAIDHPATGGVTIGHVWVRERGARGGEAARGDPPPEIEIVETGWIGDDARFAVDVRRGQKTGLFLDQRDNRRTIRAHAAGQSVLNLFSYTGGFSLHAALGGAARVTSVDVAPAAIAALARNAELSGVATQVEEAVAEDAFEFLARAARRGRRWDLVIADPPSFAPSERAKPSALGAYRKLATAALSVVEPQGRFALASCSSHVTEGDLLSVIATVRPHARLRWVGGAASDHPVLAGFPEGRYLKFLFFDV